MQKVNMFHETFKEEEDIKSILEMPVPDSITAVDRQEEN